MSKLTPPSYSDDLSMYMVVMFLDNGDNHIVDRIFAYGPELAIATAAQCVPDVGIVDLHVMDIAELYEFCPEGVSEHYQDIYDYSHWGIVIARSYGVIK